ncbi:MAG: FecR domain-containing protein [Nitrosomonadaceae bacterium]|jgi:hypothetical protein|nr:FecR domain-containing protein [Nitrosomonadaceae bacterium]
MKTTTRATERRAQLRVFKLPLTTALATLGAVLLTTLSSVTAYAASGSFTFVTGSVFVETNGQRRAAMRGTEVNPGDLIIAGPDGMAQLSMIDQAKLSLRANSQLRIERYQRTAADTDGAILNLVRGTLRTFTGLLTASNRDKFQMKTRVATVGIRGSGNILSHEEGEGTTPVTINHTIEGSHIVASLTGSFAPIITFPNDTVKVEPGKPPERIPTPPAIVAASNTMVVKEDTATKAAEASPPPTPTTTAAASNPQSGTGTGTGTGSGTTGSGSGPTTGTNIVPPVVIATDPTGLHDVVVSGAGSTYSGQAVAAGLTLESAALRGFSSVAGGAGTSARVTGGTAADVQSFDIGNSSSITIGRWNAPTSVLFTGLGSFSGPSATTHFAYGSSGYPPYLSDVLTGTATYTQVGATAPTNDAGIAGSVTSTTLNVNFSARTLNATIGLNMPAGTTQASYTLQARNVPFTLNSFFALTGFGLDITRTVNGQSTSSGLFGILEGSFVGAALNGAILGYTFSDSNVGTVQTVNGVLAFRGPTQDTQAQFVYGLISDPTNSLARSQYSQGYATINRPSEVLIDSAGRVASFRAPYARADGSINFNGEYTIGSAQVLDNGVDASTGLAWGRWSGGTSSTIGGVATNLINRSLHYVFSSPQSGPTTLPLTGTGVYEVAGATRPTDTLGNVGTMNSATLNANFSNRTVDASINVTVANQTWNATATGMAIYRDMTFSANTGRPAAAGLPAPTQLNISCVPACAGATGSLDGFFTGRTGQGAGVQYNFNNNVAGAIAFRRRG